MPEVAARTPFRDWLSDMDGDWGTAGESVAPNPIPAATRTAAAQLAEDASHIRSRAKTLTADAGETVQRARQHEWEVLTQQRLAQGPGDLLAELGGMGFAWRDIARLVGVSVPAVQKWRRGERITGENRRKIARLLAACDFLLAHFYVDEDIASWFESPIHDAAPLTPIDLWAAGRTTVFFEYAVRALTPEGALNEFDPEWRERYRTEFETFRDADGQVGIRVADR